MDWNSAFGAVNLLAMIAWGALILLPRWPALLSAILYLGGGLLCLLYAGGLLGVLSGLITGGSQGASILSQVVPDGLAMLPPPLRSRLQVTQQCTERPQTHDYMPTATNVSDKRTKARGVLSQ